MTGNIVLITRLQNGDIPSDDSESGDECNNGAKNSSVKSLSDSGYETKPQFIDNNKVSKYKTVPSKLDTKQLQRDELDDLLQVERQWKDNEKPYQTLPNRVGSNPQVLEPSNSIGVYITNYINI